MYVSCRINNGARNKNDMYARKISRVIHFIRKIKFCQNSANLERSFALVYLTNQLLQSKMI